MKKISEIASTIALLVFSPLGFIVSTAITLIAGIIVKSCSINPMLEAGIVIGLLCFIGLIGLGMCVVNCIFSKGEED